MDSNYLAKLFSWISTFLKRLFWVRPSFYPTPLGHTHSIMDSNVKSTCSSPKIFKYDVFLSFRGKDTRNTFIDHLYAHLIKKGIFVFKDDKVMEEGKLISFQLVEAVRESRVSIIVFSRDYAASSWCLDEMATIADCQKEFGQTVFPVFYDVDPSDVRKQAGVYHKAFVLHSKNFKEVPGKVDRWRRAMTTLANLVGWDVRNKPEFGEIENIVVKVTKKLDHKFSLFADDLIGIQPRVERLENFLKLNSEDDDFRVLGIWGMGGIGKTVHATVLYDRISYQFDACCFIENVSKSYRDGGAIVVQKQILRQTLEEKNLDTYSPSEISGIIRNMLHNIKVLIVLDNVDQLEQLQELAINPKLLRAGSRMILISRDEHILRVYGADVIHEVPLLNHNEARELLCRKAFKVDDSCSSVVELVPEVLKYVQCFPLAIKVVGSFLCTRDAAQWRDALDRLRNNPHNKVMDVLQISFDGLQLEEKEIFLHIACFFKGEREDYVKRILDCCGLNPSIGIPILSEKSLITIRNQEIHMHDMLQQLGKKIVQEHFPKRPEKWSRLWLYQDFHHVMTSKMGARNVEAIVLDNKEDASKYSELSAEELSKLKGLRLLILSHKNFSGDLCFLSNNLQYLFWHGYPFTSLPSDFQPNKLVELNISNSSIKHLWKGSKHLPLLKRMDLSNSKFFVETPDLEGSPNLERLDLMGCTNLSRVHPSIGILRKLSFLSLRNCSSLISLGFGKGCNLSSLRVLHLSGCTILKNTPNFTGLSNLEYLDLDYCISLTTVDQSIGDLAMLKFLSLRHCLNLVKIPNNISTIRSLQTLDLYGCSKLRNLPMVQTFMYTSYMESLISLDIGFCNLSSVSDVIGELRCLERLNLEGNNFVSLPNTFSKLSSLAYLNVSHCHELKSFPSLPLDNASTVGKYFKTVSQSRNHRSGLYIFDCSKLYSGQLFSLGELINYEIIALKWLIRLIEQPCHFRCGFDIVYPGTTISPWFNHQFIGHSVIRISDFNIDENWNGFAFSAAFEINGCLTSFSSKLPHPLYLSLESEHVEESFDFPLCLELDKANGSKHVWIKKWGLKMVFQEQHTEIPVAWHIKSRQPGLVCGADHLNFDYVHESNINFSVPKIQLPYNWLVTKEEEDEKMEAEEKENSLFDMDRGPLHRKKMGDISVTIRDHQGKFIAGATRKVPAPLSLAVEGLEIRESLLLAQNCGCELILIEFNCLSIVEACREEVLILEIASIIWASRVINRVVAQVTKTSLSRKSMLLLHLNRVRCWLHQK